MVRYLKITEKEFEALADVLESSYIALGQIGNEALISETLKGEKVVKAICKRNDYKVPKFILM